MSSASAFGRDHGLIHEAVVTGRKAGWGEYEWGKLAHDVQQMRQIGAFLRGDFRLQVVDRLIDCDIQPFTPEGWVVERHRQGGVIQWSSAKLELRHPSGGNSTNAQVEADLKELPAANANVLDYLLEYPHLIPKEWLGGGSVSGVLFWGTIYTKDDGLRAVRKFCPFRLIWLWHVIGGQGETGARYEQDWVPGQYPAALFVI